LLAVIIVLTSVSLTVAIILKVYRLGRPARALRRQSPSIELSLQQIHYTESEGSVKKWDLYAASADYDKERNVTRLAKIRLVFPKAGSREEMTLTADRATYDNAGKDVHLSGNVVAGDGKHLRFTTERLSYVAARSLVTTQDRIEFVDGPLTVQGTGMDLSTATGSAHVLHGVTATISPGTKP
jgi:LPS export ABC transporter protein LptC